MLIREMSLAPRATVSIHQERPYDYDEARGLWLYRTVDEDEQVHNLVTDAGRVTVHTYIYGTSAQRAAANLGANGLSYIGLTNDAGVPAAGDTALAGELSGSGLTRAAGVVTLPVGAGTITTIQHVFTFTGASQGVQKSALFDATTFGNMAHEVQFTQRLLFTNDTLTLTYAITLA